MELFGALTALQRILREVSILKVPLEDGEVGAYDFEWKEGASEESIAMAESRLGRPLPEIYRCFLRRHNGITLYKTLQWGYRLLGTEEIAEYNPPPGRDSPWPQHYLVFGHCRGDGDVLVFDLEQPFQIWWKPSDWPEDFAVRVGGDEPDPPLEWPIASRSFHEWLEHLIMAQGCKFWEWY